MQGFNVSTSIRLERLSRAHSCAVEDNTVWTLSAFPGLPHRHPREQNIVLRDQTTVVALYQPKSRKTNTIGLALPWCQGSINICTADVLPESMRPHTTYIYYVWRCHLGTCALELHIQFFDGMPNTEITQGATT